MCSNGLRTLVCGYNILDSSFWNETRQKDWLQNIKCITIY